MLRFPAPGVLVTVLLALPGMAFPFAAGQTSAKPASPAAARSADQLFHAGYAAVEQNDLQTAEADFARVVRLTPQVPAGHAAYGSVLLSLGKLGQAIHELETAHAADPAEPSATLNLTHAYAQAGHPEEALGLLAEQSKRAAAMTPELWYAYAQLLLGRNEFSQARETMLLAVAAYPQSALLADTLGVVLARMQDYPGAEQRFRQAEALDATMAGPHLHLGNALLLQKHVLEAIVELKRASALHPEDPEALLALGSALTADRQDGAALEALEQALQRSEASPTPMTLDIQYALGLALQNSGRNQDALPFFREVAAARPDDAAALTNLGLSLVELGKAKEALPYYEQAQALHSRDWILQQDMGVAYLQQSDLNGAIEHFQSGLAIDPTNAQLHYDLGLAYKLKDNYSAAIAAFILAEQEDPSLADTPYTLGVLYMQTGRFAEAHTELQKAVRLRPENGDAWSVLGSVAKSLNQVEDATGDLQTAIRLQPSLPGNHVTLAAIYAQQGKRDEATAERRIAADLSRVAVNRQKSSFALDSGRAFLKQGQVEDAVRQFMIAINGDPQNAAAHAALADALAAQGKTVDAALERQKAAALGTP